MSGLDIIREPFKKKSGKAKKGKRKKKGMDL